jgi:hypothetical protein
MPKCVSIIVCQGSSLDAETKNISIFNCIEEVQAPLLGVAYPFEIISLWMTAEREINQRFEVKLMIESPDGVIGAETPALPFDSSKKRHRLKILGFPAPKTPGQYHVRMAWRNQGTENWTKESVDWPIEIKLLQSADAATAQMKAKSS